MRLNFSFNNVDNKKFAWLFTNTNNCDIINSVIIFGGNQNEKDI